MFPTSSYDRLYYDIIHRYDDYSKDEYVTFGILIADARQTEAREFILNYLDLFDKHSGKYFDFFIPGYNKENWIGGTKIEFNGRTYYFKTDLFNEFCNKLNEDFNIEYTFNPMLVLMTMKPGNKSSAKYIIIELDDYSSYGVKRSGTLFMQIFKSAKSSVNLQDISNSLERTFIKGNLLDAIINSLGQDWLCEIRRVSKELNRYKIK